MKKNNLLIVAIAILSIGFTACSKQYNAKNALKELQTSTDGIVEMIHDIEGSEVVQLLSDEGTSTKKLKKVSEYKELALNMVQKVTGKVAENTEAIRNQYLLEEEYGTYTWNFSTEEFDFDAGNPSNKIVFKFPSEQGKTTNNAVFTLSTLEEIEFTDEYGTYYQIGDIAFDLSVDGTEQISLDLKLDWDMATEMPKSIDATLYANPYTLSATGSLSNTTASYSISLSDGSETLISSDATLVGNTDTEEVSSITGFIQLVDLKVLATADVETIIAQMEALYDADSDDDAAFLAVYNDNVQAELLTANDKKIGDLKLVLKTNSEITVVVVLKDGEEEDLTPYGEQILTVLESAFENHVLIPQFDEVL